MSTNDPINKVKPISPDDINEGKLTHLPDSILEALNKLITQEFNGRIATIKQEKIVEVFMLAGANGAPLTRNDIFEKGYLNFVPLYRASGWKIDIDRPGYNESYDTVYTFEKSK